jgi:hypothetical protein
MNNFVRPEFSMKKGDLVGTQTQYKHHFLAGVGHELLYK